MSSRFAIVSPCPKRWADLDGNGRQRYCDVCEKSVHAIEEYSPEESDKIWRESNGHVCACLSGESPPEPRSRRAVLLGALLTMVSPLMAQAGRVRIRVTDATGAVIPDAEASLQGPDDKPTRRVRANDVGEIILMDLPMGDSRISVVAPGFSTQTSKVTVRNAEEVTIQAVLQVGLLMGDVVMVKRRRWWFFR